MIADRNITVRNKRKNIYEEPVQPKRLGRSLSDTEDITSSPRLNRKRSNSENVPYSDSSPLPKTNDMIAESSSSIASISNLKIAKGK
jgi:hypothetical protein